jgi:holo-[acyl-carrier protein] synthase
MMIKGIGVDILEIKRLNTILARDSRFIHRIFNDAEIAYCDSKANKTQHYAARFTAKEAFFKALGSGWRGGLSWREVWVENDELGKPEIRLKGPTREYFEKKGFRNISISVTHSREYAVAFVVIE